jgi:hypothetical protein
MELLQEVIILKDVLLRFKRRTTNHALLIMENILFHQSITAPTSIILLLEPEVMVEKM